MEEHTPEQDINLRNQAIIYAGYYTRARAEEAARRKRQVHIDALKKALGVACPSNLPPERSPSWS